ncbi:uncharacterized protein UV8b_02078 [Ustilaginoidea virens]|uniref:Transcriptional regulatory protein DEP1 n=1 Tax=Ustilaginoidea virens TaxID=1159556 RepID=A0A8E5MFI2_USTVR|nr:uncharacterized protein UV8b_02078 [Ustilaginoidea virens]QUC17837.1 hypothetical protein UV8b_02078 [Ustilaginoidea virens]
MTATVSAPGTLSPSGTGEADLEDSNVSSPLSDVEDGDANEEDIRHMQIQGRNDDADNSSLSGDEQQDDAKKADRSGSESVLSDAGSDAVSEANDTEAETERLYDTPRNQRQRDVVIDQYNQDQIFEHTPSKLRSASRLVVDDANGNVEDSASEDDASIASEDHSLSKPAASNDTSVDGEGRRSLHERKRKRSPLADQSESDQPLRKRLISVGAAEVAAEDDDAPVNDDDTTSVNHLSRNHSGGEDDDVPTKSRKTVADNEDAENEMRVAKKPTRNGSKRKLASGSNSPCDPPRQDINGAQLDPVQDGDIEQRSEDVEGDADEIDAAAKSIEEAERKIAAFKDWTHIEEMFGIFRDRLYKDRLQRLEDEEQSLLADVPTHPEYLNMKQCLDDRLERKVQEMNMEFAFRLEAHERRAVAVRAQIWGQFFQAVRERREAALESLNRQWYEVQTARRSAHSLPDYGLLFPKDQVRRVRNAIAYNTEVSALSGLAKYEGFPAGPDLKGASPSEVEADFQAIDQARRGRHRNVTSVREDYPNPAFTRLGPAGEQFIKDTPWANPHHSAHKIHQQAPNIIPAPRPNQTIPGCGAPSSADTKAASGSQKLIDQSRGLLNGLSESPELARSVLNPAVHPAKRVSSIPNIGRGPKATAA